MGRVRLTHVKNQEKRRRKKILPSLFFLKQNVVVPGAETYYSSLGFGTRYADGAELIRQVGCDRHTGLDPD